MIADELDLHVLRVFTDADGGHGNPLGVFLDGSRVPEERRQAVAAELGFSETVFVDDAEACRIRIFTPISELGFAGHPTVGTSWLLARQGTPTTRLRPPAGEVATWRDGGLTWVRARPEWIQPIEIAQLGSAAEVEGLAGGPPDIGSYYAWAWIDEAAGTLRSRYFFSDAGIGEDEATGAAAVLMGDRMRRPLRIHQGRGSVLEVRPGSDGTVEVGGRCAHDEMRRYRLP